MSNAPPTICVVDDESTVRRSLRRLLVANGFRVETFADAQTFLDDGSPERCGCLVLDVRMPGIDGLELQARMAASERITPIVFLTAHGDIPMSVKAVKAGAVDFLTKPVEEEVLLAAVNNAVTLYRKHLAETEMINAIRQRIAKLTPREQEVMRCVITGATNKKIAESLCIAEKTVKIHRARVMSKVNVASVAELLQTCQQAGIEPLVRP